MQTFVLLMKLTDEGRRAIYSAPARIQAGIKSFESMGGKVTGFWVLTGEYRYLAVGQQVGAMGKPAYEAVCFDVRRGEEVKRFPLPARPYYLAFHPNNRRLAVGYSKAEIASIYNSADGAVVADLPVGAMSEQIVAWSADGERLAVAGSDPRIQIWDVEAKR